MTAFINISGMSDSEIYQALSSCRQVSPQNLVATVSLPEGKPFPVKGSVVTIEGEVYRVHEVVMDIYQDKTPEYNAVLVSRVASPFPLKELSNDS